MHHNILIVDDSEDSRNLIKVQLRKAGYQHILMASTGIEALEILQTHSHKIDLILLDIIMQGMDGIEVCAQIKNMETFKDIPIIMVTGLSNMKVLEQAFKSGATDYITKPFNAIELHARVKAVLRLKNEMDQRKAREQELTIANQKLSEMNKRLEELSSLDGLTGISNRRRFDTVLEQEWRRSKRSHSPLSLIMLDIDKFKVYNDTYGHLEGDECLKKVAQIIKASVKRADDVVARYGGEEFSIILPNTPLEGALQIGEHIRQNIERESIPHKNSTVKAVVTVSVGVATATTETISIADLIKGADTALYEAKNKGRNQVRHIIYPGANVRKNSSAKHDG